MRAVRVHRWIVIEEGTRVLGATAPSCRGTGSTVRLIDQGEQGAADGEVLIEGTVLFDHYSPAPGAASLCSGPTLATLGTQGLLRRHVPRPGVPQRREHRALHRQRNRSDPTSPQVGLTGPLTWRSGPRTNLEQWTGPFRWSGSGHGKGSTVVSPFSRSGSTLSTSTGPPARWHCSTCSAWVSSVTAPSAPISI